ncbi:MAG: lysine--tRNA ligase [Candidatus Nanoarchaeia archaeon]|nr:lysine--tRNA ligase [Candidatus Nanoarchaeia archaeon]MDD5239518.1 lysine--tRNA ligase [Candidatus Nanoarchaeia archaeon]
MEEDESLFWADQIADEIIKERGKKKEYILASGISTSGSVHIGRLREEMTVDIVRRALESKGVKTKWIHSWDDLDRFRKVPANIPKEWAKYLGMATSKVPDPWKCHKTYAEHFEKEFMDSAKAIGLDPEYQYQTQLYESCIYRDGIKTALLAKDKIIEILNKFRTGDLGENWYPVEIYCEECGTDAAHVTKYDGKYMIEYECTCGYSNRIDFSKKGNVKLKWRIDWPMRWAHYGVDFEPGGKEHSTPGGSRDTAVELAKEVYNYKAPVYKMYDFVIVKGGGKMAASAGNVILPSDLLEVYLPEIVRFFYAGARPKTEFSIPVDSEEVFKEYEDFYAAERVYYGEEKVDEKKAAHLKRVYEMSVVDKPAKKMPVQVPFKYLIMLSQFYDDNKKIIERLIESKHIKKTQVKDPRLVQLIGCARTWAKKRAPEEYIYRINEEKLGEVTQQEKDALKIFYETLDKKFKEDDLYAIGKASGLTGNFFKLCYKLLLNKDRGPRLLELIEIIGKDKVKEIIKKYL